MLGIPGWAKQPLPNAYGPRAALRPFGLRVPFAQLKIIKRAYVVFAYIGFYQYLPYKLKWRILKYFENKLVNINSIF